MMLSHTLASFLRRTARRDSTTTLNTALARLNDWRAIGGHPPWPGTEAAYQRFNNWFTATNVLFDMAAVSQTDMHLLCLFCQNLTDPET